MSTVLNVGELSENPFNDGSDRVWKVEGVEEMMGKVLAFCMGVLLSKDPQVRRGLPMFPILTLGLEGSDEAARTSWHQRNDGGYEEVRNLGGTGIPNFQDVSALGSTNGISGFQVTQTIGSPKPESKEGVQSQWTSGIRNATELLQFVCGDFTSVRDSSKQPRSDGHPLFATTSDLSAENAMDIEENFATQLHLKTEKVKALERNLAGAELEVVELKIELEDLRVRMQTNEDFPRRQATDQLQRDLQTYRNKCETYEEEIRLILEQFPSPEENLKKERQLKELVEENRFLVNCLARAKKHVLRSKEEQDETRIWRDAERTRHCLASEGQESSACSNNPFIGNIVVEVEQPLVEALSTQVPKFSSKNGGNAQDGLSLLRSPLQTLDKNVLNVTHSVANGSSMRRRRQLQFPRDDNSN